MMCQMMGRSPTGTIGLGRYSVSSRRRVPRPPTNQHFHSLLLQFLSQDNEHLLSGKDRHTHLFDSNNWLNPIFPSSFSVHPCQERPWANTDGSQGFSRLICWGYVQLLLIQGYVPGWIRFVRQDLVSVHSDGNVTCFLIWMYFYSGSCGDTVQTVTLYIPSCMDHLTK